MTLVLRQNMKIFDLREVKSLLSGKATAEFYKRLPGSSKTEHQIRYIFLVITITQGKQYLQYSYEQYTL